MVNSNCRRLTDCSISRESEAEYGDMTESQSVIKSHGTLYAKKDVKETSTYEVLPSKFFKNQDIPPPLVNKKWMDSVYEDSKSCSSEDETSSSENREDTVPLSYLKLTLKRNNAEGSGKKITQLDHTKSITVIQRKRGRPRKQLESIAQTSLISAYDDADSGDDSPDDNADWWNQSNDVKNDTDLDVKSVNSSEVQKLDMKIFDLQVYLDLDEDNSKLKTEKKVNRRDRSKENLGVKMENSKTVFPCVECGKTFSALSTLKYHLRIHK